jgi:hypothetical protein
MAKTNKLFTELFQGDTLPLAIFTTKPTTGLTKGELMLIFHGSMPKLGVCTSTGGQTIKMIRLKTKTIGRATA